MTTLAAQPNSLQASLMEALAGPDPEQALGQAFIQLGRGADISLLLAIVKALVRAGLAGIAARLLHSAAGLLAAQPQLASLASQLDRMPSGEVANAELLNRARQNGAILARLFPHLKFSVDCHSMNATVYRSVKGNYQVVRNTASRKLDFVFPFADHLAQAAALKLPNPSVGDAYLMIGVPSFALWRRLKATQCDNGYCPPIDIVDTDESLFPLWLGLIDEISESDGERLACFIGAHAVDEYRAYLLNHPTRQPATICMTNMRSQWQAPVLDKSFAQSIAEANAADKHRRKRELDARYANRDASCWRTRFEAGMRGAPPLRVVGFTTRFSTVMQYAMRDLASAFERRGCAFHTIKQTSAAQASVDVIGEIARIEPDLLIVINHLRSELRDSVPTNIPYVCWIQDYMQQLWSKSAGRSVDEYELVLGHSPAVMTSVFDYPADRFLATSNLTAPDVFSADPVDASDLQRFQCDVSYAGHGSETPEALAREAAGANQQLRELLLSIVKISRARLRSQGWLTTQDLVSVIGEAERVSNYSALTPELRRTTIVPAAQRLIDRVYRHETLEWTANWADAHQRRFRIFGRGWQNHARLAPYASGEVQHGYEMRCMYQASAVSLQINGYGSLHQRLLDGLACGAFMISRYIPADFIREPHVIIRDFIQNEGIESLQQLLDRAKSIETLQHAIQKAQMLTGTRIAPMTDMARAQHVREHLACASLPPEDFSDSGLFSILATLKSIPHRAAADIPEFEKTTFQTEQQLHSMLDRYVDHPEARRAVSQTMRESILANDTYDALVERVLSAWRQRWSNMACAG